MTVLNSVKRRFRKKKTQDLFWPDCKSNFSLYVDVHVSVHVCMSTIEHLFLSVLDGFLHVWIDTYQHSLFLQSVLPLLMVSKWHLKSQIFMKCYVLRYKMCALIWLKTLDSLGFLLYISDPDVLGGSQWHCTRLKEAGDCHHFHWTNLV